MIRRLKAFAPLLIKASARPITNVKEKGYWLPDSTEDLQQHMERHNPDFACIYFHASWNPYMKKINAQYEKICFERPEIMHVWVDTDKHQTIKFYYDAKVEPTFLLLINGGEIGRVVGDDFEKLLELYEK